MINICKIFVYKSTNAKEEIVYGPMVRPRVLVLRSGDPRFSQLSLFVCKDTFFCIPHSTVLQK